MAAPVTVSVRREIVPDLQDDAITWLDTGLQLAHRQRGCLGVAVMRDPENTCVMHVVYRFADEASLIAWETSPQRQQWLASGGSLILEASVQRRTGIEGWFDGPELRRTVDAATGRESTIGVRSAPLRWKQAVAIFCGMLPLNILVSFLLGAFPWWGEVPVPLRSLLLVSLLVPAMTYLVMPAVTRVLRPWLRRNPGTIRSERALLEALNARCPS